MNKNVPNILTMLRIFFTPLIVLLYLLPIEMGIGKIFALAFYIIGCFTDLIDGKIARKYNLVSDFGKFMDQIADKFITTTAMILVLFSGVTSTWLSVLLLLVVVLRDILISGIRMVAANNDIVISADIYGKVKSFFLDIANMVLIAYVAMTAFIELDQIEWVRILGLSIMGVGVILAVISCINYSVNAVKALKKQNSSDIIETEKEND